MRNCYHCEAVRFASVNNLKRKVTQEVKTVPIVTCGKAVGICGDRGQGTLDFGLEVARST